MWWIGEVIRMRPFISRKTKKLRSAQFIWCLAGNCEEHRFAVDKVEIEVAESFRNVLVGFSLKKLSALLRNGYSGEKRNNRNTR
jgi:hypothetical protein